MYKEILRTIVGIEVYPILSLLIFVTVFLIMLVWVMRMDRGRLATFARLPLEDASAPASTSRPDTLGGTQL
jgi:hypothetical protein